MMLLQRFLTIACLWSTALGQCYDSDFTIGDVFPASFNGRDCPRRGCIDCGVKGYCPQENALESDGNGGLRYSDGCIERTDAGSFVTNQNCVQQASNCGNRDCDATDIQCDETTGTIGGAVGDCTCTCDNGYEGDDCATAVPPLPPVSAPTSPPVSRVVCIENGVAQGSSTGVFPEISDIDGRVCPRLGCIDCGAGLPVNGQPPTDLGYCPASEGCNLQTDNGGYTTNPNCVDSANECGGDTDTPSEEAYYLLDNGTCGISADIANKDACEGAAAQLGLTDVTVNNKHFKSRPKWPTGCWYNVQKDRLYFNKRSTNKPAKPNKKRLLCYGVPPAL